MAPHAFPCTLGMDPRHHGSGVRGCLGRPEVMQAELLLGSPSRTPPLCLLGSGAGHLKCHALGMSTAHGPVPQSLWLLLPVRGHRGYGGSAACTPCLHSAHTLVPALPLSGEGGPCCQGAGGGRG